MAEKTKKIGKVSASQWQVRDENGAVFGPVSFNALRSWVEDGRVSPLCELSSDGEKWVLAVLVEELEMNCVAEIEPGTFYGPIHRTAMRELMAAGSISADAVVYCRNSGKEAADEQIRGFEGVAQAEHAAVLSELADAESRGQSLGRELASVKAELADAESRGQSLGRELASVKALCEHEKKQIVSLKREAAAAAVRMDALMNDVASGQERIKSLKNDVASGQERVESLQGERLNDVARIESLLAEVSSGKERIDLLQSEIAAYANELSDIQSESQRIACKHISEISSLSESNATLKSRLDVLADEKAALLAEAESLRKNHQNHLKLMEERARLHAVELSQKEAAYQLKMETVLLEHEAVISRIKQHEIAVLTQRIAQLEQANQGLKEEFVNYEELKSRTGANDLAQRKLILMKGIFAEAARLLAEEDNPLSDETERPLQRDMAEVSEPEFLDYEEVDSGKFAHSKTRPIVNRESGTEAENPGSVPKSPQKPDLKGEKKWPFGIGKKSLGHESLAELEALAQKELQRLSSSQDLSAIFDKKK